MTRIPPNTPATMEYAASTGIRSVPARTRWMTRKRTGSRPIVSSASSSWFTFIVPISAANAEPERPAKMIAVKIGENSRIMTMPIPFAMKICAPNISSVCAPSKARTRPIRRLMSDTIGSALTPAFSKTTASSPQRIARGRRTTAAKPCTMAPMKASCARPSATMDTVAAPDSPKKRRRPGGEPPRGRGAPRPRGTRRAASGTPGRRPLTVARTPGTIRPSASSYRSDIPDMSP